MKISCKTSDNDKVFALSQRYKIPLLSATVFERRGINESDIKYYMEDDILYQHLPFTVDDVFSAIERIEEAIEGEDGEGEKIIIYGDRDVDGMTSTAIMYRTLKKLGAKHVSTRLPSGDEGYGLTEDIVNEIIDEGYTLCITVDNGITALNEIKKLEKSGVSVIVLDHHLPLENLPPAYAIFDPKVEGSGYPFPHLAGCAVTAKLCWALFFSRTPLFNSSIILLHAEPGNSTVRIGAVKLENLVEVERKYDEFIVGDKASLYSSPLLPLLSSNTPIVVLDKETELIQLRKVFGKNADISLEEFRDSMERVMPSTRGKTLFDLTQLSRSARYSVTNKELETLISLFRSVSIYSYPELTKEFEDIQILEAIGTIADLMPLVDENRLIVKKGLRLLSSRPPVYLSYLMSRQNLIGKPLIVSNVSYKITPVLNAAGRMGEPDVALSLLLTDDMTEAKEITDKLLIMNSNRQHSEEEALLRIAPYAEESLKENNGRFVLIDDPSLQRGLTSSLASKLANENGVPSLVLATKDDTVFGSLRCSEPWNAKDLLSSFSSFFSDYGGHDYAAGLRMEKKNKEEFILEFKKYIMFYPLYEDEDTITEVDATLPPSSMESDLWSSLSFFSPFGQESEELRYYIPKATIKEAYHVANNEKYMKFMIQYGDYVWPCVWWDVKKGEDYSVGKTVSLVFTPEVSWWKGQGKEQLLIVNMEVL